MKNATQNITKNFISGKKLKYVDYINLQTISPPTRRDGNFFFRLSHIFHAVFSACGLIGRQKSSYLQRLCEEIRRIRQPVKGKIMEKCMLG
jgi:hypothetical protein